MMVGCGGDLTALGVINRLTRARKLSIYKIVVTHNLACIRFSALQSNPDSHLTNDVVWKIRGTF